LVDVIVSEICDKTTEGIYNIIKNDKITFDIETIRNEFKDFIKDILKTGRFWKIFSVNIDGIVSS